MGVDSARRPATFVPRWGDVRRRYAPLLPWLAFGVLGGVLLGTILIEGHGSDAHVYYNALHGPTYDAAWHDHDSYVYSPAFAQVLYPFTLLPWPLFLIGWTLLNLVALAWMAGPLLGAALLIPFDPVYHEIRTANIDLLVGAAIILGFRWPASWAFVLLTKVTPGVGLLWFGVRREWRSLAIALGATAAIVGVSAALSPALWAEWIELLIASPDAQPDPPVLVLVPLPLAVRLLMAAVIIAWAAPRDYRWALVLACFIASPLPTIMRASMLVALIPLIAWTRMLRGRSTGWADTPSPSARPTSAE